MPATDTSEKGLESLIVESMTGVPQGRLANVTAAADAPAAYGGAGWLLGNPPDYNREYAVDPVQLREVLAATQPEPGDAFDLGSARPDAATFPARLQGAGRHPAARCGGGLAEGVVPRQGPLPPSLIGQSQLPDRRHPHPGPLPVAAGKQQVVSLGHHEPRTGIDPHSVGDRLLDGAVETGGGERHTGAGDHRVDQVRVTRGIERLRRPHPVACAQGAQPRLGQVEPIHRQVCRPLTDLADEGLGEGRLPHARWADDAEHDPATWGHEITRPDSEIGEIGEVHPRESRRPTGLSGAPPFFLSVRDGMAGEVTAPDIGTSTRSGEHAGGLIRP